MSEHKRGVCDICGAPADIVENNVKFCATHYARYTDLKAKV